MRRPPARGISIQSRILKEMRGALGLGAIPAQDLYSLPDALFYNEDDAIRYSEDVKTRRRPDRLVNEKDDYFPEVDSKKFIDQALATLSPREETILRMRLGFPPAKDVMTLEEISVYYDVQKERIRQIEAKALRKLRHPCRSKKLRDLIDMRIPTSECRTYIGHVGGAHLPAEGDIDKHVERSGQEYAAYKKLLKEEAEALKKAEAAQRAAKRKEQKERREAKEAERKAEEEAAERRRALEEKRREKERREWERVQRKRREEYEKEEEKKKEEHLRKRLELDSYHKMEVEAWIKSLEFGPQKRPRELLLNPYYYALVLPLDGFCLRYFMNRDKDESRAVAIRLILRHGEKDMPDLRIGCKGMRYVSMEPGVAAAMFFLEQWLIIAEKGAHPETGFSYRRWSASNKLPEDVTTHDYSFWASFHREDPSPTAWAENLIKMGG